MKQTLAATLLSAAMFSTSAAKAMEIRQFDKMAQEDRSEYVTELIQGAERVLIDDGHPDQAAAVKRLFGLGDPKNNSTAGINQFMINLGYVRMADTKNVAKDPKAPRLEVEYAMIVTLKEHGITLPQSFMSVASNFKPKHSPEQPKK
jgi:hypothetical protein